MTLISALSNAVSGLNASARMAEVVSSNLANSLTEGYGRRGVDLAAAQLGNIGTGVRVVGVTRFVDAGLLADRRLTDATRAGDQRSTALLVRLEQNLGGVDDPTSLAARFANFERALITAAGDPASPARLAEAVSRLTDLAATLQSQTRSIQTLRQDADAAIAKDVAALNSGILQVDALNKDIQRITVSGNDPSGLLDQRQTIIDRLAEIVPLREIRQENGMVSLITTNGVALLDGIAAEFSFDRTATITADMTIATGALAGLMRNGVPVDPATGIGRMGGGSLGAAFTLRDQDLVATQTMLDEIAADLIARFQDPANDATITSGTAGLLTDQGGPLDLLDLAGLAGRITVNAAIDPTQSGDPSLLRDGLNATTSGPSGDSRQLSRWRDSLADLRSDSPGTLPRSAAGRIAEFTADIGARRLMAEESLSFSTAKWDRLRLAELANGVDTDTELQILLQVEKAYAANAKVLQTADTMLQRLLEI
jgi:flagellar hook-associated protein 1